MKVKIAKIQKKCKKLVKNVRAFFRNDSIKNNLLRLNIVYNNLCEKCNGIYVENEYHILFRCTKYKNEREKYLPTSLTTNPSIEKLNNVLISEDATLVKNIIDYLQEIMKNREYTKDN